MAVRKGEGVHEVVFHRVTIPRWGESIEGWLTRPQKGPVPGVVVAPDVWGVTGFVQSLCHRLSRQGYACLAVEPFSRGGGPRRSDPFDLARASFLDLPYPRLVGDIRAGLDFLRKTGYVVTDQVAALALGDGGRAAMGLAAGRDARIRGLVLVASPPPEIDGDAHLPSCPILGLYGAKDDVVSPDAARNLTAALAKAGARPELLVYPEAGHHFVDDERDGFEPAVADDAWARLLEFLDRNLK